MNKDDPSEEFPSEEEMRKEGLEMTEEDIEDACASLFRWPIEEIEAVASELARLDPPEPKSLIYDPGYWEILASQAVRYLDARRKGCRNHILLEQKDADSADNSDDINFDHWKTPEDELLEQARRMYDEMRGGDEYRGFSDAIKIITGNRRLDRSRSAFIRFLLYEVENGTWFQRKCYPSDSTAAELKSYADFADRPIDHVQALRLGEQWLHSLEASPHSIVDIMHFRARYQAIRPKIIAASRAAAGEVGRNNRKLKKKLKKRI